MRLWSIHPRYLDAKGLLAVWREGLLAKKVLEGKTRGYKNHPQLLRFKKESDPSACINYYLFHIYKEACSRGYNFDLSKINMPARVPRIYVTSGQVEYEFSHLKKKLMKRDRKKYNKLKKVRRIMLNKLFRIKKGKVEDWEKIYP